MLRKIGKSITAFILLAILSVTTLLGAAPAHAEESSNDNVEKMTDLEKMEKGYEILKSLGLGKAEGTRIQPRYVGESIYSKKLSSDKRVIDVIRYNNPDPNNWQDYDRLRQWKESILGKDGEQLYCSDPTMTFKEGWKTSVNAANYYNENTIKTIAGLLYYADRNFCGGLSDTDRYYIKQTYVWTILNEVTRWYTGGARINIEYGNNTKDGAGHWISNHQSDVWYQGLAWVQSNWNYLSCSGEIFQGDGQPLSRWSCSYNPNGYGYLHKTSADASLTSGNSNYSLEGAHYGIWKNPECSEGTNTAFTTDANGNAGPVSLPPGTYYVNEITAPKGYILDSTVHTITITSGNNTTLNVSDRPRTATINVEKTSSIPECTDGSDLYSLAGAEYSVYKDASCTQYVGKMVTDEDGRASMTGLPLNKYWVKETKVPDGYTIDPEVYELDLTSGTTDVVTGTVKSQDTPILDPAAIILRKVDKETGGDAQNNGTLAGAQFEVKFYDVLDSETDPALDGEEPLRTWIFETDEDGYLDYDFPYLVDGDELYTNGEGKAYLPYGTMTFKEIKAPEGYLINDTVIVQCTDGYSSGSIVYQTPTQEEDDLEMRVTKIDATTGKPVEGVVYEHTLPDGSKVEYKTDEDGFIDISCLEYGTHKLKEKSVPDGFAVNTAEVEFEVAKDNSITVVKGDAEETDTNGKISVNVADDGCIEVRMENKAAPYQILVHKTNEDGRVLAGAEFTLYSDADCKQEFAKGTTNTDGELYFNNLIVGKTYYMKETKAPDGYRIPVNTDGSDIVYKVQADSKVLDDQFTFIVNGKSYTSDEGTYCVTGTKAERVCEMTVLNYTGQQLPDTGSNRTILLIGAGVVLVAAAGVIALKRKKN